MKDFDDVIIEGSVKDLKFVAYYVKDQKVSNFDVMFKRVLKN